MIEGKTSLLVSGEDCMPEVEHVEASSQSSGVASDTEDCFTGYDESLGEDPYDDVRSKLDELAVHDRAMHATHSLPGNPAPPEEELTIPRITALFTYFCFLVMISIGRGRDFFASIFGGRYNSKEERYPSNSKNNYAPLVQSWEHFYTRRLYHRIQDCWNRPICSNPGAHIDVLERVSDDGLKSMKLLGPLKSLPEDQQQQYRNGEFYTESPDGYAARKCVNLGSYNYLGFADDWKNTCQDDVMGSLENFPVCNQSSRTEFGTSALHKEMERSVADFVGKEDCVVLNMGFNTNATTIPALVGRGDLIISDELNHTSIVNGARASGAAIRVFRHNNTNHLDQIIRDAIIHGRPRTRRPWGKIMVIVEGVYSMEGEYCDLKNVIKVCKKYGVYVYLDEAHSIGAMGPTGRGITEYCEVDTADVDIMMGTFTKSFGGMGGYVAGSKSVIDNLRRKCAGSSCHSSLSPVVCQQVLTAFKVRQFDFLFTCGIQTKAITVLI